MEKLPIQRIGLIGFGEAGQVLGRTLASLGIEISAFDIATYEGRKRDEMLQKMSVANVRVATSLRGLFADAELIISLVTASAATGVAKEAAALARPEQIFVDANSTSPETKKHMAREFVRSEDVFVEAAIMAPVPPHGLKVPILLGGTRASELAVKLRALGMDAIAVSDRIGMASAIKMCRSVVMKGLNALVIESLCAARRYGVEDAVLASLDATYPSMGWSNRLPDTLIFRAAEHSRRRAAELREVSLALDSAGMRPLMSSAAAEVQEWLTKQMEESRVCLGSSSTFSWRMFVDELQNLKAVENLELFVENRHEENAAQ